MISIWVFEYDSKGEYIQNQQHTAYAFCVRWWSL